LVAIESSDEKITRYHSTLHAITRLDAAEWNIAETLPYI